KLIQTCIATVFCLFLFFFDSHLPHRDLHSFPTRRSSDLLPTRARGPATAEGLSIRNPPRDARCGRWGMDGSGSATEGDSAGGSEDRKSTRLNSSHVKISYAVFCLKKKKKKRYNVIIQ